MVTKTIGPLHFEDLEPHRFEDLVRNLLYDFRDWQSIEPTGRGGSDDGYDARGFERVPFNERHENIVLEEGDGEDQETAKPDTRTWMIQCKREKQIGPSDIKRIIDESIVEGEPPFGFLLAAPVNFSKKSYDTFREELRNKGVSEFYIWGKAEIEDMLFMPKNDRILFAFMGVSLATRRRSRTTQVRATVNIKNKLIRILGQVKGSFHQPVLLRDINDEAYPNEQDVPDFDVFPRWQEHVVIRMQPNGLVVEAREHYAYVNQQTREFDIIESIDLVSRSPKNFHSEQDQGEWQHRNRARLFHELIPQRNRAIFRYLALVRFDDLLLVDDKGDSEHDFPHLFLDMELGHGVMERFGPFNGKALLLKLEPENEIDLRKGGYKRCDYFPKEIPPAPPHNRITTRKLNLKHDLHWSIRRGTTLLFDDGQVLGNLAAQDVIEVEGLHRERDSGTSWVEVIAVEEMSMKEAQKVLGVSEREIEPQLGKKPRMKDQIRVIEVKPIYEFAIRNDQKTADAGDLLD